MNQREKARWDALRTRSGLGALWDDEYDDLIEHLLAGAKRREQHRATPMPVNGASVKLLAELAVKPRKRQKGRHA